MGRIVGTEPVKAVSNAVKWSVVGGGIAGGVGLGAGLQALLPSAKGKRELAEEGIRVPSDQEAIATVAPLALATAAGINAGLPKRSPTAAVSTAILGAAAVFSSPMTSLMSNADSDSAPTHMRTILLAGGAAAGGVALGSMNKLSVNGSKLAGLALVGIGAGALAQVVVPTVPSGVQELRDGFRYRDR